MTEKATSDTTLDHSATVEKDPTSVDLPPLQGPQQQGGTNELDGAGTSWEFTSHA